MNQNARQGPSIVYVPCRVKMMKNERGERIEESMPRIYKKRKYIIVDKLLL